MSRVVLHLGQHLTGMRAVQDLFFAQRAVLAQNGVVYPNLESNRAHHVLAAPWIPLPGLAEDHFGTAGHDVAWKRLAAEHQAREDSHGSCLLLSAEAFSRASPKTVNMRELAQRLSAFGKVQIVLTLRPQATLLPALWLELARHQSPPAPGPFMANALRNHIAAGVWLDFNRIYDHLRLGFAPEQITVLDLAQVNTTGLLAQALLEIAAPGRGADLAAQISAPKDAASDALVDPIEAWPLAVLAAARINTQAPPDPNVVARIAQALGLFGQSLFTRAEYHRLGAVFDPLNAEFEARMQAVQPGFALTPAVPPDFSADAVWREDLTPERWAEIAATLYRSGRNPQILKDVAPNLLHKAWRRILDICLG